MTQEFKGFIPTTYGIEPDHDELQRMRKWSKEDLEKAVAEIEENREKYETDDEYQQALYTAQLALVMHSMDNSEEKDK